MGKALLTDLTRCIGCRACQTACKQWNRLPAESTRNLGSYENPLRRSAKTWTTITFNEVEEGNSFYWIFAKRQCMHCEHPACASACIVGALKKTAKGPVAYDDRRCIGCRYCMLACPYGSPTFEWDRPIPYICKCTMCEDRQSEGKEPACVATCPTGAITFGERDDLLQEAHSTIRAKAGRYVDHIYGEKEAGGASELYLSSVPFEKLGFPALGPEPISRYADAAMLGVPPTIAAVGTVMGGLYWFVKRRERLMNLETGSTSEKIKAEEEEQDGAQDGG